MRHNRRKNIKAACGLSHGILLFLLFLTYTNFAVGAQTGIIIKGNITNIPTNSPKLVHLYSYYGIELSEDASASVNEQGDFKLEIKDTLQQGLYKIGLDQKNAASIVLSGEKSISIKADYGQLKADRITVTNSRGNEAYRVLLNEWKRLANKMAGLSIEKSQVSVVDPLYVGKTKDIEDKMRLVIEEHNVHLLYIKETYPDTFMAEVLVNLSLVPQLTDHPDLKDSYDNERAFMHDYFFEYIDFDDERIICTPFLQKKYFTYLDKYTHHTPEGIKDSVGLMLAKAEANSAVREFTLEYLIDTFNNKGLSELADYVVDNYVEGCGKPLSERTVEKIESLKRLRVGQIAPEIVSKGTDGNTITLSSLIRKNNVLMVYFWASWCEGCEAENPNIVRLYNKFKDRGLDIYAVALDKDKAQWLSAIKKYQFTWTNVSDLREWESEAVKVYNVNKTPTIYLLDKKGRIMAKNLRGKELEKKVEGLLN
jgi:peroxiredoxin